MIPVALFAYARPAQLERTLACLRSNRVPFIYAFSDGARTAEVQPRVEAVRRLLGAIDWCDVSIVEREENLGLGRSIRAGVGDVLTRHEALLVVEDDLVCVDGTYDYLTSALEHYRDDPRVMSVTGWTHPRITPGDVASQPYFDGRAECWIWGTWRRAWRMMEGSDALTLIRRCEEEGIDPYSFGADLVEMAAIEHERNIWAVRFLYLHMLHRGLCLRPPHSLVEHIGFGVDATNAAGNDTLWENPPLRPCPSIPRSWPEPVEHPGCRALALRAYGSRPQRPSFGARLRRTMRQALPQTLKRTYHRLTATRR